jgi:16S rRNA (cytosine1402-N4)-methyltransferase
VVRVTGQPLQHTPVMLAEIVALLSPALAPEGAPSGEWAPEAARAEALPPERAPTGGGEFILVDCTVGLGGHAEALLKACPQARLIGLDRDPQALAVAADRLAPFADRITLVEAVYDQLPAVLQRLGQPRVQGVLLDLGLSSLQIDQPERGFAYSVDAPLDMRMDGKQALTAAEVLNTYSARELARVLRWFGEERFADRIAKRIVAERDREPFSTSARLVSVIHDAIPAASRKTGGHPAKRTFQALRIEVNSELAALESVLPSAIAALALGGRIAVLAYHSLEDRLVKQILALKSHDRAPRNLPVVPPGYGPELTLLTRGALRPTAAEAEMNRRAASARLRAAMRIEEAAA